MTLPQVLAVEIQKLEDLTSSKSLTKERFFAAVKLARVMLSSAREQRRLASPANHARYLVAHVSPLLIISLLLM